MTEVEVPFVEINIHFKKEKEKLLGFIEGEIDTFTASALRKEFEALKITEGLEIYLDLTKVSYLDSTGLGIFISFYKRVLREKGSIKLIGLSERLQRLFVITGLSEVMDVEIDKKVVLSDEGI